MKEYTIIFTEKEVNTLLEVISNCPLQGFQKDLVKVIKELEDLKDKLRDSLKENSEEDTEDGNANRDSDSK